MADNLTGWLATWEFRYLKLKNGETQLQQLFKNSTNEKQWRPVPTERE